MIKKTIELPRLIHIFNHTDNVYASFLRKKKTGVGLFATFFLFSTQSSNRTIAISCFMKFPIAISRSLFLKSSNKNRKGHPDQRY